MFTMRGDSSGKSWDLIVLIIIIKPVNGDLSSHATRRGETNGSFHLKGLQSALIIQTRLSLFYTAPLGLLQHEHNMYQSCAELTFNHGVGEEDELHLIKVAAMKLGAPYLTFHIHSTINPFTPTTECLLFCVTCCCNDCVLSHIEIHANISTYLGALPWTPAVSC